MLKRTISSILLSSTEDTYQKGSQVGYQFGCRVSMKESSIKHKSLEGCSGFLQHDRRSYIQSFFGNGAHNQSGNAAIELRQLCPAPG